jgi:hypothetical protein
MNLRTFKSRGEYERWKTQRLAAGTFRKRTYSSAVNTVGTVFIIFSLLLFLSGTGGLAKAGNIRISDLEEISTMFDDLSEVQKDIPLLFNVAVFSLDNLAFISLTQMFIAVLMILSGAYFLKGRAWAWHAVEVFTWGLLLFVVCSGVAASYLWLDVLSSIEASGASEPPPFVFTFVGVTICAAATLVFSAFPLVGVIFLRRRPALT